MIAIVAPALVAAVGALGYLALKSPTIEAKELARITFACGLLWTVYALLGHIARLP